MGFFTALVLASFLVGVASLPFNRNPYQQYHDLGYHPKVKVGGTAPVKVRGVNIGGWLMMEPWITPSIFERINTCQPDWNGTYIVVDEYTFWQYGPRCPGNAMRHIIKQHWDEWVLDDHLAQLAEANITHIRIPFGYWYFDVLPSEPYISGVDMFPYALQRFKEVCQQAKNHGLKILFDLHGAPGSQNGFDNSGRRGPIKILEGDNLDRTKSIIAKVTTWVLNNVDEDTIFGIEALNEPFTVDGNVGAALWSAMRDDYYPSTYKAVHNISGSAYSPNVILQSAFRPLSDFDGVMTPSQGYYNVWLDDHNYQCFGESFNSWAYGADGWSKHLKEACDLRANYANTPLWTFVGEFSLAVTDCTKWLDGIGRVPQPDQDGRSDVCAFYNQNIATFSAEYKQFLNQFLRAQMDAFELADGWFFWTFRTENSPEWDFLLGLEMGWIPPNVGIREPFNCATLE
eukprot:c3969_g1_i1.p1 GENE.c3969_g1_i1~~c3969_g1_i1.p1  ORF type:complete len:470 (+),score=107.10 c3969_g1_i1:41-1411(+)